MLKGLDSYYSLYLGSQSGDWLSVVWCSPSGSLTLASRVGWVECLCTKQSLQHSLLVSRLVIVYSYAMRMSNNSLWLGGQCVNESMTGCALSTGTDVGTIAMRSELALQPSVLLF